MVIDKNIDGIVVYTDGSARPNPGFNGSGVHGYSYVISDKPSKFNGATATKKGYTTDKNPKDPVEVVSYLDCYYANSLQGTNNVAEINAVLVFFEKYQELIEQAKHIHFNLDSQYVLNCMTDWIEKWDANGWVSSTGKPVSNQEELKRLQGYLKTYQDKEFTYEWVKGHVGDIGNTRADYLAVIGTNVATNNAEPQVDVIHESSKTYGKVKDKIHPLFSLKRLYFNSHKDYNTEQRYFQTGWKDIDYIVGKRTPDAIFSVIDLKKPDEVIESVYDAQYDYPTSFNTIVFARLDRIRSSQVYPWIQHYGKNALLDNKKEKSISFVDNSPIISEVTPGELPMRAMETLNTLEEFLDRFKDEYLASGQFKPSAFDYQATDITDHFYENHELKKEYVVGIKETDYTFQRNGKKHKIKLVFESDIPGRNALKKMESEKTRIFLIHWSESESIARYVVGITTEDAVAIWSNYFANQLLTF